ncbi:MAG: TIGR02301 family protein [Hyphomicrobiaceae bacterium]|nr:TIGR02301 family protein [Hyphomicrobiaceae bacterium]
MSAILRYETRMKSAAISKLRTRASVLVLGTVLVLTLPQPTLAQLNADDRPYDDKLLRLSEILGAVHYLRELCGAREGQVWREQMKNLVDSEGTTAIRRAKLVQGFNKGYRGYRRTYRSCTEPAKLAIDRFMEEGAAIADVLLKENQ